MADSVNTPGVASPNEVTGSSRCVSQPIISTSAGGSCDSLPGVQNSAQFQSRGDSPIILHTRDRNCCTTSPYYSSLRPNASQNPFEISSSSRRSSRSNRPSITNYPYEYYVTANRHTNHYRPSYYGKYGANIRKKATQLQKADFGSQSNLVVAPGSMNMRSLSRENQQERIASFLAARQECNSAINSTPNTTSLPHPIPNRGAKSIDPINISAAKRLQWFHSLNMMKRLPVPQPMKGLANSKTSSNNTFHSSQSCIATDKSILEKNEYDRMNINTYNEAALQEKMFEDNDDMMIPDDMRRFLNERYDEGHSMFSYAPSLLTESEPLSLQQGNNQNVMSNICQNSNDGTNVAIQYLNLPGNVSSNINMPNPQINNFFEKQNKKLTRQQTNFQENQQMNDNLQIKTDQCHIISDQGIQDQSRMGSNQGQMHFCMLSDVSTQSSIETNSRVLRSQRQQHMQPQNLPQPHGLYPPAVPDLPPEMNQGSKNDSTGMPAPGPRDNRMVHPNELMNPSIIPIINNMQHNRCMPNMQHDGNSPNLPMMYTPQTPNMQALYQSPMPNLNHNSIPHQPTVPKDPHVPINLGQVQMSQGHVPQGHVPYPSASNHQKHESPQVQVPRISQSQISPKAQQLMLNNNQVMNMHSNYANEMYSAQNNMQQCKYQQQIVQQHQYGGPMNYSGFQQNCPEKQCSPCDKTVMSPVTSPTDHSETQQESQALPIEDLLETLNSAEDFMGILNSTEEFMNSINSISQENINQIYSPTAMSNRSNSQASRYRAALMNFSNMAVNDMSSVLTQLAEENKYLKMRH